MAKRVFVIRASSEEVAKWKAHALKVGMTVSEWVRRRCNSTHPANCGCKACTGK